ncbi:hypothetical protein ACI75Y_07360 [Capnocytophaga stomatis]|uniref:hypothetical protein n=1 Tax=Capnocytophaga stomatis TaxID=1848904 RepID=UPI00385D8FC1
MRKLILSMALAIVSTGAYAQGTPVADCTPTANKPEIGTTYTYQVNIGGGFNGNGKYHWYVTQDKNLIAGTKIPQTNDFFGVEATGSNYDNTNGTNGLQLRWKPDALSNGNPFYLVIKYTETKDGCDATNIKAMSIKPLNNFKLNIIPVKNQAGEAFTSTAQVCSADITSAEILDNGKVKYEYGKTTLYYKVSMTGYSGNWKPTITLPALQGVTGTDTEFIGRKYESIKWNGGTSTNFEDFSAFTPNGNTQNLTATNATNKTEFVLEIVINNGTYEGLANESVTVFTKGEMQLANGNAGARDVADDCTEITNDNNNRNANQVILARPTISAQSGEFIIQIQ